MPDPAETPTPPRRPPGRRLTDAEVLVRRCEVEEVMASGAWSMAACRTLAGRWGCSPRQIRMDKTWLEAQWTKELKAQTDDPALARASLLNQMRRLRVHCIMMNDAKALEVARRTLELEAKVMGILAGPSLTLDVKTVGQQLDPRAMALAIYESIGEACQVLGVDAPTLIPMDKLPAIIDVTPTTSDSEEVKNG